MRGFLSDLPVTIVEPSGRRIYRWLHPDGYFVSLSGMVDEDVLVGLSERVR